MSDASPSRIAAAVAEALNEAGLTYQGQPIYAEAAAVVRWDPKELANLQVAVTARSMARSVLTRAQDQIDIELDIGVSRRVDPADADAVAELDDVVQAIERALNRQTFTWQGGKAVWKGSELDPIYDPELMHQARTYLAVLTVSLTVYV